MRILHTVEFYSPSVGGMQEVVKQLSERLVALGHEVTVATTRLPDRTANIINGVKIAEFSISGNFARGISGEADEYIHFLRNNRFDVITNFAAQQWATDICLSVLDELEAVKVFVPTGFSGLYEEDYNEYFVAMKTWLKKYDMNVFLSNDYRDINFARDNGVANVTVIPNGAGKNEFSDTSAAEIRRKLGIPEKDFLILHVGSHTGVKGHRETIGIFKKADIHNATLLIVANSFGGGCTSECGVRSKLFKFSVYNRLKKKKLIILSLSRRETVAAYHSADIFLFPSNIECSPLVLFEAMAAKTPFLTTDVGNASEINDWTQAGIVLPTLRNEEGYSQAEVVPSVKVLEEIYHSREKLEKMKATGYQAWLDKFTWEKISKRYETLYFELLAKKQSGYSGKTCRRPATPDLPEVPASYDVSYFGEPYGEAPVTLEALVNVGFSLKIWGFGWGARVAGKPVTKMDSWARLKKKGSKVLSLKAWIGLANRGVKHCSQMTLKAFAFLVNKDEPITQKSSPPAYYKFPHVAFGGAVITEDAGDIVRASKINLTFNNPGFNTADFFVPLAGGFWLAEYSPEIAKYFEEGKEVVFWRDERDLIEKITYYLSNEPERRAVREAGYQKAYRLNKERQVAQTF